MLARDSICRARELVKRLICWSVKLLMFWLHFLRRNLPTTFLRDVGQAVPNSWIKSGHLTSSSPAFFSALSASLIISYRMKRELRNTAFPFHLRITGITPAVYLSFSPKENRLYEIMFPKCRCRNCSCIRHHTAAIPASAALYKFGRSWKNLFFLYFSDYLCVFLRTAVTPAVPAAARRTAT